MSQAENLQTPDTMSKDQEAPTPQDPKTMDFEDMYYQRTTQNTAWNMFITQKNQFVKAGYTAESSGRSRIGSGDGMKLRSDSQVAGASASRVVPEVGAVGGVVGGSNDPQAEAMVHEILNRYETNKREYLFGDKKEEGKGKKDDSFEFDEDDDIWDDLVTEPNGKSDFLKFTVPQYDLKLALYNKHKEKIESMSSRDVEVICHKVIPELQEIMDEKVPSKRHDLFKECGLNRQPIRDMTVSAPFTSSHDSKVMSVIEDRILGLHDPSEIHGEFLHYVSHVLVPEALIRIFALANNVPVDQAEKELRYEAGYDGFLSDEIIASLKESQVIKE